jgi:regulator of replication initiation timing
MFSSDINNQFNNGLSNTTSYSPSVNNGNDLNSTPSSAPTPSFFSTFSFFSALQGMNNNTQNQQLETINRERSANQSLNSEINQAVKKSKDLNNEVLDLSAENHRLREENDFFKKLFAQPLNVISDQQPNSQFSQNYYKEKLLLANWMTLQRSTLEIAISLGEKAGLSSEEVLNMCLESKINVILNQNDPSHGTNSTENFFNRFRQELATKHIAEYPESAQPISTAKRIEQTLANIQRKETIDSLNQPKIKPRV